MRARHPARPVRLHIPGRPPVEDGTYQGGSHSLTPANRTHRQPLNPLRLTVSAHQHAPEDLIGFSHHKSGAALDPSTNVQLEVRHWAEQHLDLAHQV